MNLLTFDTSLDKTYVTVSNGVDSLSKIVENTKSSYHSAYLISTIAELLREIELTPIDLELIATNIGPGSFTGIRACVTVAKVMAQQLDLKIVGVSSLEILSKLNNTDKETLVILDARKEKAYAYTTEILGVLELSKVEQIIQDNDYYIISDESLKTKFNYLGKEINVYSSMNADLGKILNSLALEKFAKGDIVTANNLKALYIQPPPIH